MCLAIPGRVVALSEVAGSPTAEVDYGGVRRRAALLYLPEARVGDWVIVQAGFAIRRLTDDEAREALSLAEEGAPLLSADRPSSSGGAAPEVALTERL